MPVSASLSIASAAVRAASLDLCSDEYLLLLARPGEIASVSRLSHDRADSPLWRRAQSVLANRGRVEDLISRRPSLVITMGGGAGRSSLAIASRMGWRTLALPYPATIADVERNMVRVATALGEPIRADAWRRKLNALRRAQRPETRDAIYLGGGGTSQGAASIGGQWMLLAGLKQRDLPGGRATLEFLATRPPEVILRSTYRHAQPSLGQRWLDHPLAQRPNATVIKTDGRPWTCAGPLMLPEIERLRGAR
ncbi:hypothetical protein SH584_01475 [Sphingomonas sp. LY29]|uniref:ABC transporter substrate-binding protein n=1 Tax=Sphingomonas sp. LY29 TaxID=3095341 RepID=UPI002D79E03C|nr:hypothetical protein [Sphingomonas sp. LY29]WRP26143.1 hypothetical protein SH584_01475 [Sphingomonas sp. LY29]